MTAPAELQVGSAHALIAETVAAVAHDGSLFVGVQSLRWIAAASLMVRSSNPRLGAALDERFSLGCEALALRLGEQLRQKAPS